MSLGFKDKENSAHDWPADAISDLPNLVDEQIRRYEALSLSRVYQKCQEELELWHVAAVAHLGQVYSQRLAELAQVYTRDVCPEADKFKQKMIDQLKTRIMPKISKVLDEPLPDVTKVERMQVSQGQVRSSRMDRAGMPVF